MRPEPVKINAARLQFAFRSKKELYLFLKYDVQVYLPRIDATNAFFLKALLKGEKKVITPPS